MSDVPLMYRIVKTKNWVSDEFMNFSGDESLGVIKPHGQHERDFVFSPKISGRFCETLSIVNIQNPDNVVEITVKALVRKRETFALQPDKIEFGACASGDKSKTVSFAFSSFFLLFDSCAWKKERFGLPPRDLTLQPALGSHRDYELDIPGPHRCTPHRESIFRPHWRARVMLSPSRQRNDGPGMSKGYEYMQHLRIASFCENCVFMCSVSPGGVELYVCIYIYMDIR